MKTTITSKFRRPYTPSSIPATIIRPPQIPYFKVFDEDSFNAVLPIVAEGPCMIACVSGRDHYTNDFDEAATIMSEELSIGGHCTVYPGKLEVAYKKLPSSPKLEPSPKPFIPIARVVDDASFDKATELIGAGPVDIVVGNRTYEKVIDFDEAMELITNALMRKVHPVVYGEEKK